jgi:hypothetical protein
VGSHVNTNIDIRDHLHPLKESTWTEIFPLLSYFDYTSLKGLGKPRNTSFKTFVDDETRNFHLHSGVPKSNEDTRSFIEKIAEFEDP